MNVLSQHFEAARRSHQHRNRGVLTEVQVKDQGSPADRVCDVVAAVLDLQHLSSVCIIYSLLLRIRQYHIRFILDDPSFTVSPDADPHNIASGRVAVDSGRVKANSILLVAD